MWKILKTASREQENETARVFTRVSRNVESDRIGSRRFSVTLSFFFLYVADNPTSELSGRGKTITFSTSLSRWGRGKPSQPRLRWPGKNCTRRNRRLDRHKASLRGKFSKASRPYPFSSLSESHVRTADISLGSSNVTVNPSNCE